MTIQMFCIVCSGSLDPVWEDLGEEYHAQPSKALCFQGLAHYGSDFDLDHEIIGLTHYEVFICDSCWKERRKLALGVKKISPKLPPPPTFKYFSGERVEEAFRSAEDSKKCVNIEELDTSPKTEKR